MPDEGERNGEDVQSLLMLVMMLLVWLVLFQIKGGVATTGTGTNRSRSVLNFQIGKDFD